METRENIFLFVPNIIGYGRIFLTVLSLFFMPSNYSAATFCYLLSQLLDAVDGHAARYLNQASRFGAMLDQLTDRCSTLCLCMTLATFYPRFAVFFQLVTAVDIASHWLHLHSSDIRGSKHYKQIEVKGLFTQILKIYYTSRPFLFFMCMGNELFYCMLYLTHFTYGPLFPVFRFGLWQLVCVLSAPVALLKSAISVVHLIQAAQDIADIDIAERTRKVECEKSKLT